MDSLFNVINPSFVNYEWKLSTKTSDLLCYQKENPYDVISISIPNTNTIDVTVPIGKNTYDNLLYKKTFNNINLNTVFDYVKMHLDYYAFTHNNGETL
jgi:hypothetical protein